VTRFVLSPRAMSMGHASTTNRIAQDHVSTATRAINSCGTSVEVESYVNDFAFTQPGHRHLLLPFRQQPQRR